MESWGNATTGPAHMGANDSTTQTEGIGWAWLFTVAYQQVTHRTSRGTPQRYSCPSPRLIPSCRRPRA